MKKELYPNAEALKRYRKEKPYIPAEPDMIGGKPNGDKFIGWEPDAMLRWLNID